MAEDVAIQVLREYVGDLEEEERRALKRLDALTEIRVDVGRSLAGVDSAIHTARNDVQRVTMTLAAARLELRARGAGDVGPVKG